MREIEFRGKRINYFQPKEPPKWIYGPASCTERFALMLVKEYDIWTDVERETVGQYIGLKDKNGAKIYEGDVVSCNTFSGVVKYVSSTASFQAVSAGWWPISLEYDKHDPFEVIGNIFDDPELDKQFGEVYRSKE